MAIDPLLCHRTSLCQEGWDALKAKASEALQLPPEDLAPPHNEHHEVQWASQEEAPLSWAFRGPGNDRVDSVVFLQSLHGKVTQLSIASKPMKASEMSNLRSALSQARADLERHGWQEPNSVGGL